LSRAHAGYMAWQNENHRSGCCTYCAFMRDTVIF
jgi:hypothetical protein